MTRLANIVIVFSVIFILVCGYVLVFPHTLSRIDQHLAKAYNVMAFLSMLFSAIAILIAAFAFKKATIKPKLSLAIWPERAAKEGPALSVDKDSKVTTTIPLSTWDFYLSNIGEISARNPIVRIKFEEAFFSANEFPGWKAIGFMHAVGWYEFEWTPANNQSQVVPVKLDYQLPQMRLSGTPILSDLSIEIKIAADEVETISYKRPVEIWK